MIRFEFTLKQFWERCDAPVYNMTTGELIDSTKMSENKDLEVTSFDVKAHFENGVWLIDGIEVLLESEDDE